MKRLSLIALMLFVSCISLNAQTTSTPKAVVAATTPQILYRGVDNPISIAVDGISDEYIIAEVTNGSAKIKKVGKGSYIVNIEDKITLVNVVIDSVDTKGVEYQLNKTIKIPNDVITIDVYSQLGKEKVFLNQTTFKVKDIVYPNAKVIKSDGGLIDKKDLEFKKNDLLVFKYPGKNIYNYKTDESFVKILSCVPGEILKTNENYERYKTRHCN